MEHQAKRAGPRNPSPGTGLGDVERPLRRRADVMLAGQKEAFELVLAGGPLSEALEVLARTLEVQSDGGLLASLALVEGEARRLHGGARGSLPSALCDALEGLAVDTAGGPVSEAARHLALAGLEDVVEVDDVSAHDAPVVRAVRASGLRALWVTPVVSTEGELLGLWLLHRRQPGRLADADLMTAQEAAQAAALLVEHHRRQTRRAQDERQHAKTLSTLAHDMRNPLAPIRNTIELLHRAGADPVLVERACSIMSRQVGQLARLMEELSDLSHSLPQGPPVEDALPRPSAEPQLPLSSSPPVPEAGEGAYKVLVADDNELVRESFVELLRAEGYDVRTAADGVQAVEMAEQWRPQAVLLDIHMPRLSGLETARRLRSAYPSSQMSLMMMSGMTLNDAWMRHARAAGFDDCVDKTADPKVWLARLRAVMPRH